MATPAWTRVRNIQRVGQLNTIKPLLLRFYATSEDNHRGISSFFQSFAGLNNSQADEYANAIMLDRELKKYYAVGQDVVKCTLTKQLLQNPNNLSCQSVMDIISSVTSRSRLFDLSTKAQSDVVSSNERFTDDHYDNLMSLIGVIHLRDGYKASSETATKIFTPIVEDHDASTSIKLQHPKLMLSLVNNSKNLGISSSVKQIDDGSFVAEIYCQDELLASQSHPSSSEVALSLSCKDALTTHFMDDLKAVDLPHGSALVLEEEVQLGFDFDSIREVDFHLDEDEKIGIFLRGGEYVQLQNREYSRYHEMTPVYISEVLPGSIAEQTKKFKAGDVVLAINDRSLRGMSHDNVVKVLKSYSGNVKLTVRQDREAMLLDRFTLDFQRRISEKVKGSQYSERWKEWHLAQAKKDPKSYLTYAEM